MFTENSEVDVLQGFGEKIASKFSKLQRLKIDIM
jgi:hypothetical protein